MERVTLGTNRPKTYGQMCHSMIGTNQDRQRDSIYQRQFSIDEYTNPAARLSNIFEKYARQHRQTELDVENDKPHTETGGPYSLFLC